MCSRQAYHHKRRARHQRHEGMHPFAQRAAHWAKRHGKFSPPVNVLELDDHYEIYLSAPGRAKEDFKISLADNVLTIEVDKKDLGGEGRWQRQEFSIVAFSRSFELNDKIDADSIEADYENGILKLTLSKKEGFETIRKDISIA